MHAAFQTTTPLLPSSAHAQGFPVRVALTKRPSSAPRLSAPRPRAAFAPVSSAAEGEAPEYRLAPGEIAVRFINTPSGTDVVAAADQGDNLLTVGDTVGIHIPRACQTGLCGSCTCDVLDTNAEDGRQTVRACQTGVVVPDGGAEMVVDVARMRTPRTGPDPMARFENLDTQYVAGKAPRIKGRRGIVIDTAVCPECDGTGEVECYQCDGAGEEHLEGVGMLSCAMCGSMKTLRCAECQGTGQIQVRR